VRWVRAGYGSTCSGNWPGAGDQPAVRAGGRNTKIHALSDAKGRLIVILLTGGEAHDCPDAERLFRRVRSPQWMAADASLVEPGRGATDCGQSCEAARAAPQPVSAIIFRT
jgi:hypothetical protein